MNKIKELLNAVKENDRAAVWVADILLLLAFAVMVVAAIAGLNY